MFWKTVGDAQYLAVKETSESNAKTYGRRDEAAEQRLTNYQQEKERLNQRVRALDAQVSERAGLYRRLRMPSILDRQAEILRRLDVEELLGTDLMVVGTNAFIAYELACGARFPTGNEETEDFDMAWCRGSGASLASTHPMPSELGFEPMASLIEQEWLLRGRPISVVVATIKGRACPLYVPDPRWMALHKMWLAEKPERNPAKKGKDLRQGNVLLDAVHYFLADVYPLDVDFLLELPEELRSHFDKWCETRKFTPQS